MMNDKISKMLNDQFNAELYSAYLYLAYTDFFDHIGLDGFANWYRAQSLEELDHAGMIRRYLTEQGEHVRFDTINEVSADGMDVSDILAEAQSHEQKVTEMIYRLYKDASAVNDLRTMNFLNWFIREQAEEEKNAGEMLQKRYLYGRCHSCDACDTDPDSACRLCGGGLYALNQELAHRDRTKGEYSFA